MTLVSALFAANRFDLPVVLRATIRGSGIYSAPKLRAGASYTLRVSFDEPRLLQRAEVIVRQGGKELARKTLHAGDPDYYTVFEAAAAGDAQVSITAEPAGALGQVRVNAWPAGVPVKREGVAAEISLDRTVFGAGDQSPYIPLGKTGETYDWYRFRFDGAKPRLAFFELDLTERDNVPVDVAVFRERDGKKTEYTEGEDPVSELSG